MTPKRSFSATCIPDSVFFVPMTEDVSNRYSFHYLSTGLTACATMAAPRQQTASAKQTRPKKSKAVEVVKESVQKQDMIADHLPPLPLVMVVMWCSSFLMVLAMRDFVSTGRNILGEWDEPFLVSSTGDVWPLSLIDY